MGSTAYGIAIQATGQEKEMYRVIKNYILGLDSRITCDNDPDDEFDVTKWGTLADGYAHIPKLEFSINGTHIFTILRERSLCESDGSHRGARYVDCKMDAISSIPDNYANIVFRPDGEGGGAWSVDWSENFARGVIISHIVNDSIIYIGISSLNADQGVRNSYNWSMWYNLSYNVLFLNSAKQQSGYNKTRFYNLSDRTLYRTTDIVSGTFLSRFTYAAPPGSIDYIKSSIYMSSNEKVFENRAIYDSTTVTIGDTVSLKDGAYVAIGTHQLVKVS